MILLPKALDESRGGTGRRSPGASSNTDKNQTPKASKSAEPPHSPWGKQPEFDAHDALELDNCATLGLLKSIVLSLLEMEEALFPTFLDAVPCSKSPNNIKRPPEKKF